MKDVVLITGPAGFIGFKTLLTALEAGHYVRAVIRKPEQAQSLKTHVKIAPYAERLEFTVVPDLTKYGAFDHVLSDVTAILHIASPLAIKTDNYERDIINPAVQMSTSLLKSALNVPSIKRIVITSSMVTLIPFEWLAKPEDRIYTAKDLNCNPTRSVAHRMEAYWNCKALARIAVRDFVNTNSPHFETIQMFPGVVIGPDDRALRAADSLNNAPDWDLRMSPVLGVKQTDPMVSVPVRVVDVAKAHVDAIKPSIPGNRNYTLSSDSPEGVEWDSMINFARKYYPDRVGGKDLPLGGTLSTMKWRVDSRDTEYAFGWKFATFEETIKDMLRQYTDLLDRAKLSRVKRALVKASRFEEV